VFSTHSAGDTGWRTIIASTVFLVMAARHMLPQVIVCRGLGGDAGDFALDDLTRMDQGDIDANLLDTHPAQQTGGRLAQQAGTTVNSITPSPAPGRRAHVAPLSALDGDA
jgi:hypothetical protein